MKWYDRLADILLDAAEQRLYDIKNKLLRLLDDEECIETTAVVLPLDEQLHASGRR